MAEKRGAALFFWGEIFYNKRGTRFRGGLARGRRLVRAVNGVRIEFADTLALRVARSGTKLAAPADRL